MCFLSNTELNQKSITKAIWKIYQIFETKQHSCKPQIEGETHLELNKNENSVSEWWDAAKGEQVVHEVWQLGL